MIKTLGTRTGESARNYWNLAGCSLPPLTDEFRYVWNYQGVTIIAGALELKKGENIIDLPTPLLTKNCILLTSMAPNLLQETGLTASMPVSVWGCDAALVHGVKLVIKAKESVILTGPLAQYYLISNN